MEKRIIEETFPIKEIGKESAKEKRNRHGHISTVHIWWARRPQAASRGTIYAALVNSPVKSSDFEDKSKFIINLSKWENSLNNSILMKAKQDIFRTNKGKSPIILDPFAGGGSIPLEAMKLGCETYASDYNPVATLILKCTLEYPQKFSATRENDGILVPLQENSLLTELKKWSLLVLDETKKEIGTYYPDEKDGSILLGWIWSRTVKCKNPNCEAVIPLLRQFLLSKTKNRKVSLFPYVEEKKIKFKILDTKEEPLPKNFDPSKGTISKAIATCLICGSAIDSTSLREIFMNKQSGEQMLAVISQKNGETGKRYRLATKVDIENFNKAEQYLTAKRQKMKEKLGYDPVPDEIIPTPDLKEYSSKGMFYVTLQPVRYGMTRWGDLFNSRQKLALITFLEKIREAYKKMKDSNLNPDLSKAIVSYLAIAFDRLADYGSVESTLNVNGGRGITHTFGRQTLSIIWDYMETNHFNPLAAGWISALEKNLKWITSMSQLSVAPVTVTRSSAMSLDYPDEYFDAVITDPPYYDNVPYSLVSDFFYVWLKRILGDVYPDLFSTPLTPKSEEAIAEVSFIRGISKDRVKDTLPHIKTKEDFEKMLSKSFKEIHRILKNDGITVVVYAHKSTEGWETLIKSLLESGLVVSSSWPINTEMEARLLSQESAALASSIYIVARKSQKVPLGFYKDVKNELKQYLNKKLETLWTEGISGADFFISAIGSAIEVFGKYERVVDDSDNPIEVTKLLNDTREIVTNYAIKKVLHGEFSDQITQLTRFYILWRWAYGEANIPYDDANKLAHSVGLDLTHEWNKGFIVKEKEVIKVLGPQERKEDGLNDSHELIDILHYALLMWKRNKKEDLDKTLNEKRYSKSDMFKRVAQAISESLPTESTEKKWLDGFLTGFKDNESPSGTQTKLF